MKVARSVRRRAGEKGLQSQYLVCGLSYCPGNNESAGKRHNASITQGNPWLRAVLGEVVWSISRTKDNYLAAQYRRLARRRGAYKAVVAVAHCLLVIIYHMLRDKKPYKDLGGDYFDQLDAQRVQRHHVRQLEQLGFTVTLAPKGEVPSQEPAASHIQQRGGEKLA